MTVHLELRHAGEAARGRTAQAWFVPGATAAAWLDELLGFGIDLRDVVLLPVPASRARGEPVGVVAVLPPGVTVRAHARAEPWQCRAERVVLPANAALWPPLDDDELRALVPGAWLVLHPSVGPVAFADGDVRRASDLLTAPASDTAWHAARPGVAAVARLVAIEPAAELTIETLFGDDAHDIGAHRPHELPPRPGERDAAPPRFVAGPVGWLARFLTWATRNVPRTAAAPTWVDRLQAWANRQRLPPTPRADRERRRRELDRLLALLRDDPLRGLRFALPLRGPGGRGLAPPGNRLGTRRTDFDLGRLRGGAASDPWEVDAALHAQLEQRYRELANREIAAKNHRRAAYIFAHLLGDLRAAAQTLRDGGFHREAAILFRDRLDSPDEAVRCWVAGGMFADAAAYEEQRGRLEEAGDLWFLLGEQDRARELWRRECEARSARGDVVGAALLRAEKLGEPEAAARALEELWWSRWHERAFAAWAGLVHRLHGHEPLLATLARFEHTGGYDDDDDVAAMACVLTTFAAHHADEQLRDFVRDHVRRAVAQTLGTIGTAARQRLLGAVRRTAPDDRVLVHDVRRIEAQREPTRAPVPVGQPQLRRLWQCVGSFRSAREMAACGGWFVQIDLSLPALGRRAFAAEAKFEHRAIVAPGQPGPSFLLSVPTQTEVVWARLTAPHELRVEWLDVSHWPSSHGFVGVLEGQIVAVDANRTVWTVGSDERRTIEMRRCSLDGSLLTTESTAQIGELPPGERHAVVVDHHLVMAFGNVLIVRPPEGPWRRVQLPSDAHALVPAPEPGNARVLVGLDRGFAMFHVRTNPEPGGLRAFAEELERPTLGWTRTGLALAVGGPRVHLFRFQRHIPPEVHVRELRSYASKPTAILPTAAPDEVVFVAPQTMTCFAVR